MDKMKKFVHLHVHSNYSIMDGLASVRQLVDKAEENDMLGIALTDHGNMFGTKEFYDYVCSINNDRKEEGLPILKPIIGCELYVARHGLKEQKNGSKDMSGYSLVVLAKNYQGYRNLIRLVSYSWVDGYYVHPRTDRMELEKYHEGLIVLSGDLSGEVARAVLDDDIDKACETIEWYRNVFADDYYLELQRHEVKDSSVRANRDIFKAQEKVNTALLKLSKAYGVKVVGTNDVHFADKEDAEAHDHLLCMATGKELDDASRVIYTKQEWLKTSEEMYEVFSDIPEAIENTMEVFNKVELYSLNHTPVIPSVVIPKDIQTKGVKTDEDYLATLVDNGAKRIYGENLPEEVRWRIDYELDVIKESGNSRYFIIMQDIINHARYELGAIVGPGRGSVAGSLVAYCLGITKIDPLKHDLLFERFMCPGRKAAPDIDIDLDEEGRQKVKEWLKGKYGWEKTAHIITFSKMSSVRCFKEMARLEKVPKELSDRLYDAIPDEWRSRCLDAAIQFTPELYDAYESDKAVRNAVDCAIKLDGTIKGMGIHACGLVFSDTPIGELVPVCVQDNPDKNGDKVLCTQYDGWNIESAGLVKWDFLGLNVLGILNDISLAIKENKGVAIDLDAIPIDDPKTFELFQNGMTQNVFQFDTIGMRQNLKYLKPTVFDDLVLLNAMYRPGPMDWIPQMIERKKGKEKIIYLVPAMEKYLKETYGLPVYQEQIMLLSSLLANFSRSERDNLRKALARRKEGELVMLNKKFMEGGKKNGYKQVVLKQIWEEWNHIGQFAFNKAHAVCYTWIAYQMAYLKANYPEEFNAVMKVSNK